MDREIPALRGGFADYANRTNPIPSLPGYGTAAPWLREAAGQGTEGFSQEDFSTFFTGAPGATPSGMPGITPRTQPGQEPSAGAIRRPQMDVLPYADIGTRTNFYVAPGEVERFEGGKKVRPPEDHTAQVSAMVKNEAAKNQAAWMARVSDWYNKQADPAYQESVRARMTARFDNPTLDENGLQLVQRVSRILAGGELGINEPLPTLKDLTTFEESVKRHGNITGATRERDERMAVQLTRMRTEFDSAIGNVTSQVAQKPDMGLQDFVAAVEKETWGSLGVAKREALMQLMPEHLKKQLQEEANMRAAVDIQGELAGKMGVAEARKSLAKLELLNEPFKRDWMARQLAQDPNADTSWQAFYSARVPGSIGLDGQVVDEPKPDKDEVKLARAQQMRVDALMQLGSEQPGTVPDLESPGVSEVLRENGLTEQQVSLVQRVKDAKLPVPTEGEIIPVAMAETTRDSAARTVIRMMNADPNLGAEAALRRYYGMTMPEDQVENAIKTVGQQALKDVASLAQAQIVAAADAARLRLGEERQNLRDRLAPIAQTGAVQGLPVPNMTLLPKAEEAEGIYLQHAKNQSYFDADGDPKPDAGISFIANEILHLKPGSQDHTWFWTEATRKGGNQQVRAATDYVQNVLFAGHNQVATAEKKAEIDRQQKLDAARMDYAQISAERRTQIEQGLAMGMVLTPTFGKMGEQVADEYDRALKDYAKTPSTFNRDKLVRIESRLNVTGAEYMDINTLGAAAKLDALQRMEVALRDESLNLTVTDVQGVIGKVRAEIYKTAKEMEKELTDQQREAMTAYEQQRNKANTVDIAAKKPGLDELNIILKNPDATTADRAKAQRRKEALLAKYPQLNETEG